MGRAAWEGLLTDIFVFTFVVWLVCVPISFIVY